MFYSILTETLVGPLLIAADQQGLRFLMFSKQGKLPKPEPDWQNDDRQLREPVRQLRAYFKGKLRQFDLPLAGEGTDFQKRVWKALCDVPYGQTASYGEIAAAIGQPTASRAVGMANGRNPISIIVPCHRIIGSNGKLVGYGGGLDRKISLLKLEGLNGW